MQFIDLAAQQQRIAAEINQGIQNVLAHGGYIMGKEVKELEAKLSEFCGAKHSITCSNGTDALGLFLMAKNLQPNDAVFVPAFTFTATPEVVYWTPAQPIFVDVIPETFNICPESLKRGIELAKQKGLNPAGVMAVDLFGQPADYDPLEAICKESGMWLLCDSAQGFGGVYKGRKVGTIGDCTTTSFFPAKPLGCYGDGGAVFCEDDELAQVIDSLRVHGKGTDKYDNVRIGMNGRLDTMQAAILLPKLAIFEDEIKKRNDVANRYAAALGNTVVTPTVPEGLTSVWAQYTLRVEGRAELQAHLKSKGIPTAIYYPKPLHQQTAFKQALTEGTLPVSCNLSEEVLSLPMHPYLSEADQATIINAIGEFYGQNRLAS